MRYFVLAGEPSGDLHAASLIETLRVQTPNAEFYGMGGDRMQAAGVELFQHYTKMAYMGVIAVLRHVPDIIRNFRIAHETLLSVKPDVLILVDYPSFNLKIAAFVKKHLPQTKIIYYIPPKVWAWKTHRIHRIAALCDEVWGIFPFEPAFYARYGYRCTYVGNPTVAELSPFIAHRSPLTCSEASSNLIAILPGSRKAEIKNCLPVMLAAARQTCHLSPITCNLIVCAAPSIPDELYRRYMLPNETLTRDTYGTLAKAKVAVVNSGTATLEAALIGCPQVAVYRIVTSRWLGWLRPFLFKIPYFTLVNLIANEEVIYEAIGPRFTQANIERELHRLLTDDSACERMQQQYANLRMIISNNENPR